MKVHAMVCAPTAPLEGLCGENESTPPHTGFDDVSRPGLASNLAVAIADRPGTDSK